MSALVPADTDTIPWYVQGRRSGAGKYKGEIFKRINQIYFKFDTRQDDEDGNPVPHPDRLQLSAEHVSLNGAYLLDCGDQMLLFLGKVLQPFFCEKVKQSKGIKILNFDPIISRYLGSANQWMLMKTLLIYQN